MSGREGCSRWCEQCQTEQKMRVKHCYKCQRCVYRFDHHCFWVGACVGEKNHVWFYWFLATQSIMCMWTAVVFAEAFVDVSPWLNANWIQLLVVIDAGGVGLLPLGLWGYHTYLVLTGQTTWEDLRTRKIEYLRGFELVAPFSKGVLGNVVTFCSSWRWWAYTPVEHQYEEAMVKLAASKGSRREIGVWDNPWNNKYYSCC
ncbi:zinc finger protein [Thecamonas trahens ATCC 50062]|uniref:Palmitoyltransferase n=1 Tax=Thecamonas trahens ATCC 50062 TaxID=461836 RepID=A0A0L0DPW2_THETB|nr:zinc finger protein [Thecamonas trahens ATCC 50062]KNC53463.1 zinc finger protein [Thecamonas trahens ATCC 50062]|eukprot:XP_013761787.1 zinc finger protein [Thecamonas trahens ATCC 50062]